MEYEKEIEELLEMYDLNVKKNDFGSINFPDLEDINKELELDDNSLMIEFDEYLYDNHQLITYYRTDIERGYILIFNIDDVCDCGMDETHLKIDCEQI